MTWLGQVPNASYDEFCNIMERIPQAHWVRPARWRDSSTDLFKQIESAEFCSERVRRWRGDLRTIASEISGLYVHRQVYDTLGSIIAANEDLQRPNQFLSELFEWYVMANVVLAERDAQRMSSVVSLANLLFEIAEHPEELSLRSFRKMHTGSAYVPLSRPNDQEMTRSGTMSSGSSNPYTASSRHPMIRRRSISMRSNRTCVIYKTQQRRLSTFAMKWLGTERAMFQLPAFRLRQSTPTSTSWMS